MSEAPISPTLSRLIREVRRESVTSGPNAYNRMYNRHMRSHGEVDHNRRQEAEDLEFSADVVPESC